MEHRQILALVDQLHVQADIMRTSCVRHFEINKALSSMQDLKKENIRLNVISLIKLINDV